MRRKLTSSLSAVLACVLVLSSCPPVALAAGGMDNFKKAYSYPAGKFTDVPAGSWFAESVQTAYELGLVKGDSETAFAPNGPITLSSALALACRLHSLYNTGAADFEQGTPWYTVYVDYAVDNGIITAGQFSDYNANATRRQFAGILAKALPEEALAAMNTVEDGAIPDVPAGSQGAEDIYRLYRAGILTGNDERGVFAPDSTIDRASVAAIVSRMAIPALRRSITLEYKPAVGAVTGLSASADGKQAALRWNGVDGATGYNVYMSTSRDSGYTLNTTAESASATVSGLSGSTTYFFKVAACVTTDQGKTFEGPHSAAVSVTTPAAPVSYSGNGNQVVNGVDIPAGSYYAEFKNNGSSNFIAKLYYGDKSYDYFLLANEIGACAGQFSMYDNGNAAIRNGMLEVESTGDWTIEFKPVSGTTTTNLKGSGTIVTGVFTAPAARNIVSCTHDGSSNFIVKIIKYNGTKSYDYELVTNEIGSYSGQKVVTLTPGTQYYFYVEADGSWTVDFGLGAAVSAYAPPSAPPASSSGGSSNGWDDDDDWGSGSDSGSGSGSGSSGGGYGVQKFSYTDAKNLSKYANDSTTAINQGLDYVLDAKERYPIGGPAMRVLNLKMAVSSGQNAATRLGHALDILDNRVELTLTDGSTERQKVREAYNLLKSLQDIEITEDNIDEACDQVSDILWSASAMCLGFQNRTIQLLKAFT